MNKINTSYKTISEVVKIIGLKSKIITDKNWKSGCDWALKQIKEEKSCALIIRRMFHD